MTEQPYERRHPIVRQTSPTIHIDEHRSLEEIIAYHDEKLKNCKQYHTPHQTLEVK